MAFKIISENLTGKPDETGWAQTYEFKPEDSEILKEKGHLFVVLGVSSGSSNLGVALEGRDILSKIQKDYFDKKSESILYSLKDAVKKASSESLVNGEIQIALAVIRGNSIYLVASGRAGVYLFRQGVKSQILKSSYQDIKSTSGAIHDGDMFLIGTDSFFSEFGGGVLNAQLASKNTKSLADYFTPLVHSQEGNGGLGLTVLSFNNEPSFLPANGNLPQAGVKKGFRLKSLGKVPDFFQAMRNSNIVDRLKLKNGFFGVVKKDTTLNSFDPLLFIKGLVNKKSKLENSELDESFYKRRKVSASVGIVLLFLLLTSIFFGIRQKRQMDYKHSYEQELSSASHELEESQNLYSLNPDRSKELFSQARSRVLGLSAQGIQDSQLQDLKNKIEKNQGQILGEYSESPQLFVDLGLLSSGFKGTDIALTDSVIYVLDKDSKRIIKVVIPSKHSEVAAGPSKIDEAFFVTAYFDNVYIVNSKGVFEESNINGKVIENNWQGDVLISSFAGNIYVLDKKGSTIWRYSGDGKSFNLGKKWLSEETGVDLSNAKSWSIDGNIWVLTDAGKVYKFTQGNLQQFKLSETYVGGFNADYIFTNDEAQFLYLLDRNSGRILVFSKDGEYKAQYISEEIKNTQKFIVSEKENKIILLDGNKLNFLDIKHL